MPDLYRQYLHRGGHEGSSEYLEIFRELGVDVQGLDGVQGSTFALIAMLIRRVKDLETTTTELKARVKVLEDS